ncbi:uncharacterized protein LOC121678724 [Alosa sapidissima]|uniref:uncharacterized protein LOC121678724 n=1 Tax=Alosa sapidissima TaxID=34773 RepID=UPI001C0A47B3|nr:uncharacterized protein LOC121678724 [Alosa sapidissima]
MFSKRNRACASQIPTTEKGGMAPPQVSEDEIVTTVRDFLNGHLRMEETENRIEMKYGIVNDDDNLWPKADLQRAWGKMQRLSDRNKLPLSLVILNQAMLRREAAEKKEAAERVDALKRELSELKAEISALAEKENSLKAEKAQDEIRSAQCARSEPMPTCLNEQILPVTNHIQSVCDVEGEEMIFNKIQHVTTSVEPAKMWIGQACQTLPKMDSLGFTAAVCAEVGRVLGTQWPSHGFHHPQSFTGVERMNHFLKESYDKGHQEGFPWFVPLPPVVCSMSPTNNKETGLGPLEVVTGKPMSSLVLCTAIVHLGSDALSAYCSELAKTFKTAGHQLTMECHKHLDGGHSLPGHWAMINNPLSVVFEANWEGPFHTLLATDAVSDDHG